jgi:hypothetical protein
MAEKNVRSIDSFLRKNIQQTPNEKVKFDRFSEPFEIKAIPQQLNEQLQKAATRRVKSNGVWTETTDTTKYVNSMVVASVVWPDLNNNELQSDFGTLGQPDKTLEAMLLAGEYAELAQRVQALSGFDLDGVDEKADELKN